MKLISGLALAVTGVAGIILLAVTQAELARQQVHVSPQVNYLVHVPPQDELSDTWEQLGFRPPELRNGTSGTVPRSFLASLPPALANLENVTEKKRLFIATVLPLILRTNELIMADRQRLERLIPRIRSGARLNEHDREWLVDLARRYGLGEDTDFDDLDLDRLLLRVDIIPPSLALAQAAIESGWGTSRFAKLGNAIYGQWTWKAEDKGIVPLKRQSGKKHRIRAFDFLIDSVRIYAYNLNRSSNYRQFRLKRAEMRASGSLDSRRLADTLIRYSERREEYVRDVRVVIDGNRLTDFDDESLAQA